MTKTAVLTGGSSGIGLALANILVSHGYDVYSVDSTTSAETTPGMTGLVADIRNAQELSAACEAIPNGVDLLVNNAGVMRRGTILESADEDIDLLLDVHVKGALRVFRTLQPKLSPNAVIMQMASRHAVSPPMDPGIYGLSKQAAAHVAGLIARTYAGYQVKIAFPGPTDTPLGRHQVSAEAMVEKKKIMSEPAIVAAHIWTLIDTPQYRCLNFDQQRWQYVFEEEWPTMPI